MVLFSERTGITPRKAIQVERIDEGLRNRLWSVFRSYYLDASGTSYISMEAIRDSRSKIKAKLWDSFFKWPLDIMPVEHYGFGQDIREWFFSNNRKWYELYNLLEFMVGNYGIEEMNTKFIADCNAVLKEEVSAYRFVDKQVAQITSNEEIREIEEALENTKSVDAVHTHLETALVLYSNKTDPDYRNSMKESISAVEALCRKITGKEKATLGDALGSMQDLHPALRKAFESLYGYTNDAEGIRHALPDKPTLCAEDAKFMLVICSAFINYLQSKM
ncbi:MAG: hypothetical protein NT157_01525 [Candidatus Micrarchaeota archaeon]|nr:hypothetical protein [Candidatus Micrarchaeota archaeon]